ncbi:hypothetical protein MSI_07000 [Treponema sp. JC4]|uniref:omptin family outer membrane protease n=1 Tax=Treponema sp. JC4 TaxID=1124982 RepID=UPI00025B04C1|nr:omptin family outer membrane protease [Treponema sp. JC4]EID86349.1 hypothetical protein MSI_07000 [Treponema sp. JC4]
MKYNLHTKIKYLFSIIFLVFCGSFLIAKDASDINAGVWRGFYVSAAPLFELKNGNFSETTCRTATKTKYTEILWKEDMNCRVGAKVEAGWWFIGLETNALFGIPKSNGKMSENWWTAAFDPNFHLADFECDTKLISDFEIDSRLKFDIPLFKFVRIRPYAGFCYNILKLKASDANGKAGSTSSKTSADSDQAHSYKVSGERVAFDRETFDFYLGLQAGVVLFDRLTILGDFNASPVFYINTIDHHYADTTASPSVSESYTLNRFHTNFPKISFGGCLEYRIWKELSAGASFYYTIINSVTGEEYTSPSGSNYKDHNGFDAETSQSYWKASVYAKYRLKIGRAITPRPHEKRARKPKVRNGKVEVRQY